jgi:aspartate racemase
MKKIGLIGGMTWESTLEYYRIINESVKEKLGGLHSADCILCSFDFANIEKLQIKRKWRELTNLMIDAAQTLEKTGAEFVVICANTMHKTADEIQDNIRIPILHITDVTAEEIIRKGLKKVGLLGTIFTMEEDFYKRRLKDKYDIDTIIPSKDEREIINDIIYKELSHGITKQSSKENYIEIINNLLFRKAEGIILGCTEIPLLIKQKDVNSPVFDTTMIHAKAAVEYAIK